MPRAGWLQITDYSNKHRVSVSTLRRRIKAEEIEYQFEDGKYWLPDAPVDRYVRSRESSNTKPASATQQRETTRLWEEPSPAAALKAPVKTIKADPRDPQQEDSGALAVAREMIKEMKAAYVQILQEKEEQILILKEELTDLRTLCRILESDNDRLKNDVRRKEPAVSTVTSWLDDEPDSGLNI